MSRAVAPAYALHSPLSLPEPVVPPVGLWSSLGARLVLYVAVCELPLFCSHVVSYTQDIYVDGCAVAIAIKMSSESGYGRGERSSILHNTMHDVAKGSQICCGQGQ